MLSQRRQGQGSFWLFANGRQRHRIAVPVISRRELYDLGRVRDHRYRRLSSIVMKDIGAASCGRVGDLRRAWVRDGIPREGLGLCLGIRPAGGPLSSLIGVGAERILECIDPGLLVPKAKIQECPESPENSSGEGTAQAGTNRDGVRFRVRAAEKYKRLRMCQGN